ncbi:uncharacterized protein LOC123696244 [Colias croceus]|uniref:uncharacterized protein LOC123696244 n=1 Tax=Colias crocea TaxID=72248 RepID=UPI001E2817AC|nr:uncharacterized protein LOC123696244 [Colias croceus]
MASPKPPVSCSAPSSPEESSVVQVLDSNEPLASSSSSVPLCVQVIDSSEPLVPVLPVDPVPGCSRATATEASAGVSPGETPGSPALSENSSSGEDQPSGSSAPRKNYYVEEIRSQWNHHRLFVELNTLEQCLHFAEERGMILREKLCSRHRQPMSLHTFGGQLGSFRCRKSTCRHKSVSRSKGTWFENVHLPINIVFQIMYLFSVGADYNAVQRETARRERDTVLSTKTIADWFSYCRETIVVYELEHQESGRKIGGPGKIVQVDESKFGKRKYNRGRRVEGHWVLGMIENGSQDLRLEVCPNNERSSEILVPLIQKHVEEGTEIHTDFWRAYDCLPQYGYIHKKCNHSDPEHRFVAPDGTHTQRIESQWRNLKRMFAKDQYKGNFTDWLIEYNWRKKIIVKHKDPFEELLTAVNYVYK